MKKTITKAINTFVIALLIMGTYSFSSMPGSIGIYGNIVYAATSANNGYKANFSYPNNAVAGTAFAVRDQHGNILSGRSVYKGDKITVLNVDFTTQLVLLEYPTNKGVRTGYIKNDVPHIIYNNKDNWHNGSTSEPVLNENESLLGLLNPYEKATILYKNEGMTYVVYNTVKGANTKSGYVKYSGMVGSPAEASVTTWMKQAMTITHTSSKYLNDLLEIAKHESSDNPNEICTFDLNAKQGHPSKGLMQLIDSTFYKYRNTSLPNCIFNPVANIVASINYINGRYGSISKVPGIKSLEQSNVYIGY